MAAISLKNKRALVTGASRGIGLAIAASLASEGASLFLSARDDKTLDKIEHDLSQSGPRISHAAADLNRIDEIEKMFAMAVEFLGGIDILVNNAGIGIKKPAVEMTSAEWDEMSNVNLRAPFILAKLAAPLMMAQKSGHVINIGSGASQTPIANLAGYCATKHGLLGFSESLALELRKHGIKVSIILPGSTASSFSGSSPRSKLDTSPGILRPEDIANSVLYLLKQSDIAWTSVMNLRPLNPGRT